VEKESGGHTDLEEAKAVLEEAGRGWRRSQVTRARIRAPFDCEINSHGTELSDTIDNVKAKIDNVKAKIQDEED
jgi:hypothetical protein